MRACVCPSVDTLTVAFLSYQFSPNWTQTCKPPKVRTSLLGVNIAPPLPLFSLVNRRFQAKLAKSKNVHIIKTIASIPTKFCTVIKTTKCPSWVVLTRALQIPRWRTAAILEKSRNCYISAAVRAILMKFGTQMQFDPLDRPDRGQW